MSVPEGAMILEQGFVPTADMGVSGGRVGVGEGSSLGWDIDWQWGEGVEREGRAYQAKNATSGVPHSKEFGSFLAFSYRSCSDEGDNEAKLAENIG